MGNEEKQNEKQLETSNTTFDIELRRKSHHCTDELIYADEEEHKSEKPTNTVEEKQDGANSRTSIDAAVVDPLGKEGDDDDVDISEKRHNLIDEMGDGERKSPHEHVTLKTPKRDEESGSTVNHHMENEQTCICHNIVRIPLEILRYLPIPTIL